MVEESRDVLKLGGNITGNARQELEEATGKHSSVKRILKTLNYWMNN